MDNATKKLVAQALLEAASSLSASTEKRLKFVWPKLDDHQKLVILGIVFNAIGLDDWEDMYEGNGAVRPEQSDAILEFFSDKLQANHLVDSYIPWMASRMGEDYHAYYANAVREFRSICLWAKETKTDLNKLSLEEALTQSRSYVPNAARKGKVDSDANPTVYTFADGHKVVQLKTDEALKREGDIMKHCVGDYCDAVKEGTSRIYSLRTPNNEPLVTIETQGGVGNVVFKQMFGHSNSDPSEKEKPYLIEFVEKKFDGNITGMILAGETDFQNADLTNANISRANMKGSNLKRANLSGANLYRTDFTNANLSGANLEDADIQRATFLRANLRGANLNGVSADGAKFIEADLAGAKLRGAGLFEVSLLGANLEKADLTDADLRSCFYDDTTIWPDDFDIKAHQASKRNG